MSVATMITPEPSMAVLLRALKLPTFARLHEEIAHKAEQQGWSFALCPACAKAALSSVATTS